MIRAAVAKAQAKHPDGLGDHPMVVLMEEVGEVAQAYLDGTIREEISELLDVCAVCVRRIESLQPVVAL